MRFKDINSKKIKESKNILSKLEKKKSKLESALRYAKSITKDIKRDDTHINILSRLGTLAEEFGLELDQYQESKVMELHNQLESEVYELEEVFNDAIRDLSNKIDDIEYGET